MNEELLTKILDSEISRDVKEKIVSYWMLPTTTGSAAPINKHSGRVGAVKRPSKEDVDLKNDPKKKEEVEAKEDTLKDVV